MNILFVLSLDWPRFSISQQVSYANRSMQEKVCEAGLSKNIIFNCASLGAGERILPFRGNETDITPDILDELRYEHHKIVENLRSEVHFQANRDMLEMLSNLRASGHQLAAVATSDTGKLEKLLEDTRARDFFDDSVYGYDRVSEHLKNDYTLASLFITAVMNGHVDFKETLVVADMPETIEDAVPIQPLAVVGYVDPYVPWNEQSVRIKEMEAAGANYTAVGGHTVINIPWHITGRAEQQAKVDIAKAMGRDLH
jgi:beta-phosphoglucomutase-like phosphatase (HAD superfamily)